MNKLPRGLTLKIGVIISLLLFIAIALVGFLFYTRSTQLIKRQSLLYAQNICENLSRDIDGYVEEMERTARILLGNQDVQNILQRIRQPGYTDFQRLRDRELLRRLVLSFTSVRDSYIIQLYDSDGIGIHFDASHFIYISYSLFENAWLRDKRNMVDDRSLFLIPPASSNMVLMSRNRAFFVVRPIRRITDNRILGYLTVVSDVGKLRNIFGRYEPLLPDAQIELVTMNHVVALSLDPSAEGGYGRLTENSDIRHPSSFSGWTTVVRLGESYGKNELLAAGYWSLVITLLASVFALAVSWTVSYYVFKPFRNFVSVMDKVGKGNFAIVLDEKGVDSDLRMIFHGFNKMVSQIRELIHSVYEERIHVKSAQLEALQYQINPHFLYNTFQTIESIGELKDVPEVQIIAQSLGRLLRYNIQGGSKVALIDEINHVSTYFEIEKIRFGNMVECFFDIQAEAKRCIVLKFLLQPLIENAVTHGFGDGKKEISIHTKASIEDSALFIRIADNGLGMSPERIAEMNRTMDSISSGDTADSGNGHIGVLNVHKRIVHYYGGQYGLRLEAGSGGVGITSVLKLPAVFAEAPVPAPTLRT